MASYLTTGSAPYLCIFQLRIHPSFFVQEPDSNKAHCWLLTSGKAFESPPYLRTGIIFINVFLGRIRSPCDSVVKDRFRKIMEGCYIIRKPSIGVTFTIPSDVRASLPNWNEELETLFQSVFPFFDLLCSGVKIVVLPTPEQSGHQLAARLVLSITIKATD